MKYTYALTSLFLFPIALFLLLVPVAAQEAVDGAAPTISGGSLQPGGTVITLIADEPMTAVTAEGGAGFSVVTSEDVPIHRVVTSSHHVILHLSTAVPDGEAVTVSYQAPQDGGGLIADAHGNALEDIASIRIDPAPGTSDPPVTPSPDPVIVEPDGEAVTVSYQAPRDGGGSIADAHGSAPEGIASVRINPAPVTSNPPVTPPSDPVVVEEVRLISYKGNIGNMPTTGGESQHWTALPGVSDTPVSPWDTAATYQRGDTVQIDGDTFSLNIASNRGDHPLSDRQHVESRSSWVPADSIPSWSAGTYEQGAVVLHNGVLYRRTDDSAADSTNPLDAIAEHDDSAPSWSGVETYSAGDIVQHNGARYESTESSNRGYRPMPDMLYVFDTSSRAWVSVDSVAPWNSATTYVDDAIVRHNGSVYASQFGGNSGHDPAAPETAYYRRGDGVAVAPVSIAPWYPQTGYTVGDLVAHNGIMYRAAVASVNFEPSEDRNHWAVAETVPSPWRSVTGTPLWRPASSGGAWVPAVTVTPWSRVSGTGSAWSVDKNYRYGDIVVRDGTRYFSTNTAGHNPRYARPGDHVTLTLRFSGRLSDVPLSVTVRGEPVNFAHTVVGERSFLTGAFIIRAQDGDTVLSSADIGVAGVALPVSPDTVTVDVTAPRLTDGSLTTASAGDGKPYRYPSYSFTVSEDGVLSVAGVGCGAEQRDVVQGSVTVSFPLPDGTYACSLSIQDEAGNVSSAHHVPSFTIDTPDGAVFRGPLETISVKRRKTRIFFDINVEHWFPAGAAESAVTVAVTGGGDCEHVNDRLRYDGQYTVSRKGDEPFVSATHTVRTKKLDDGSYEGCSLVVGDASPVAIEPFDIREIPSDVRGPSIPSSQSDDMVPSSPDRDFGSRRSGDRGSDTGDNDSDRSAQSDIRAPTFPGPLTPTIVEEPPAQDNSHEPVGEPVTLQQGVIHTAVRDLQRLLNDRGFSVAESGPGSPGNETNVFGPATNQAVRALQETTGHSVTGEVAVYFDNDTGVTTFLPPFGE